MTVIDLLIAPCRCVADDSVATRKLPNRASAVAAHGGLTLLVDETHLLAPVAGLAAAVAEAEGCASRAAALEVAVAPQGRDASVAGAAIDGGTEGAVAVLRRLAMRAVVRAVATARVVAAATRKGGGSRVAATCAAEAALADTVAGIGIALLRRLAGDGTRAVAGAIENAGAGRTGHAVEAVFRAVTVRLCRRSNECP